MRILVTGGSGFIGSNFIRLLFADTENHTVVNVDKLTYAGNPENLAEEAEKYKDRYTFVRGDIADFPLMRRLMAEHKADAVVNFAAESHVDRSIQDASPFITTNVQGTLSLLSAAKEIGVPRFLHVSTDEVYGSLGETGLFTEQTPLAPNSPYSASKASSDLLCRAWFETYGFPVIITRCSNNYGPCQFPEKLIPLMYLKAKAGEPLPLYGDGKNVRDWIHVEDHCRGVLAALRKGRPGAVYNLGGAAERSNLQVVKEILAFCGRPDSLISFVQDRPGHDRRYAMDFSLASRELGFAPAHTFEEGLRATLQWYEANPGWVERVVSGAYREYLAKTREGGL